MMTDTDFHDLSPTITYRHLLSKSVSNVKNPLRVIALCDSDAFYAACEQVRLGIDPNLPLVVQQWNMLIAVNYPARKFGISRMDKIEEAKKRCPTLNVVHVATYRDGDTEPRYSTETPDSRTHKVSLDHYRRESAKIINLFKEIIPTAEIEKASIDEAFVDFTQPVIEALLQRFPHLSEIPPDSEAGLDTPLPPPPEIDWGSISSIIPLNPPDSPGAASTSAAAHDHEQKGTWHDMALTIAAELMATVRREVHEKLGYTMSAGIARNKFLAKLSASFKKPNSQSILRNAAIPGYLRPLAFQKIRFLGGKLGKALAEEYDAQTVGDLLSISLEEMQRKFGEESLWVYEVLRGIDRSEVKEKPVLTKSMMASKNLPKPITIPADGVRWLSVLASELALRLTEARETVPTLWPKSIVLHIRQDWKDHKSKQIPFPFTRNLNAEIVRAAGERLWKELVGLDNSTSPALKVTQLALGFHGIEALGSSQQGIEGFLKGSPSKGKRKREDDGETTTGEPEGVKCARCQKSLRLSPSLDDADEETRKSFLESLRVEHEDWHFAKDLAKLPPSPQRPSPSPSKKKPKSDNTGGKSKGTSQGIAKYFPKR